MIKYNAIKTVGPRDIIFRSRIEAKWAWVFESFGWDWEYEPVDLNGYIPDFIIRMKDGGNILVEIKSDADIVKYDVYKPFFHKIVESGWNGNFIILGGMPTYDDEDYDNFVPPGIEIGICGKIIGKNPYDLDFDHPAIYRDYKPIPYSEYHLERLHLFKDENAKWAFGHGYNHALWAPYVIKTSDKWDRPANYKNGNIIEFKKIWSDAINKTQYSRFKQ